MTDSISTRRVFIQKGLTLLAVAPTIPLFLDRTVLALANPLDLPRTQQPTGKDGKILVVVQLSGGNDGLNTVVPFADPAYYRARPTIGKDAKSVLKLNDVVGLHPNLVKFKELHDKGLMGLLQGVGYPNPNRSHFRSMDIWHTAAPDKENVTTGWIGRYFDNTCAGADPHAGVSMGETLPPAMQGERITPLAFERPEMYRYLGPDPARYKRLNRINEAWDARNTIPAPRSRAEPGGAGELDFLQRTAMDAQLSSDRLLSIIRGHKPAAQYPPGEFGLGLQNIAAMIGGGLPTRVYYVSLGGFDTHANEVGRHDRLMTELAQGISAFWSDITAQKDEQRVLMMTFSEFGRRVAQNASGGTDHGTAAPMFLFGASIKPGLVGQHPSLTQLDHGDLIYNTDFRSVYATLLQDWLDAPSKPILGQQFKTLSLFRA